MQRKNAVNCLKNRSTQKTLWCETHRDRNTEEYANCINDVH